MELTLIIGMQSVNFPKIVSKYAASATITDDDDMCFVCSAKLCLLILIPGHSCLVFATGIHIAKAKTKI